MATKFTADAQNKIAEALKPVLAESVQLYVLTQNVHWNVTGPMFQAVHSLTEAQYLELAPAIDEIAERIRTLRHKAPASLKAFASLAALQTVMRMHLPKTWYSRLLMLMRKLRSAFARSSQQPQTRAMM